MQSVSVNGGAALAMSLPTAMAVAFVEASSPS
jgi:hypothetical protein